MQTTFKERLLKVLAEIDDLDLSNFVLSQQMGKSKSYRTNNLTGVSYVLKFRSIPKDQQKVILDLIDTCYKYAQSK